MRCRRPVLVNSGDNLSIGIQFKPEQDIHIHDPIGSTLTERKSPSSCTIVHSEQLDRAPGTTVTPIDTGGDIINTSDAVDTSDADRKDPRRDQPHLKRKLARAQLVSTQGADAAFELLAAGKVDRWPA